MIPMLFMIPLGFGVAAATTVGNYLGERRAEEAKRAARLSWCLSLGCTLTICSVLMIFRYEVVGLFTGDDDVKERAAKALPFVLSFEVLDSFQGVSQGIVRGAGRPNIGVGIMLFGNYCVGLPLSYYFGLHTSWGLSGLWLGMNIGYGAVSILFAILIFSFNWDTLALEAVERSKKDSASIAQPSESKPLLEAAEMFEL